MKRRTLLKAACCLGLGGLAADQWLEARGPHHTGRECDPSAGPDEASLLVRDPSQLRMLQFTDLHFFQRPWRKDLDRRTLDDMRRMVDLHHPDLLLITGDLWNNNPLHLGPQYLDQSLAWLAGLGVPWLFTWGNHDRLDNYVEGHRALATAQNSLYRGGRHGGCYRVHLQDRSGKVLWDLLCLNSSGAGLAHEAQTWLRGIKTEGPKAFAIFHIPLQQQATLWQQGDGQGVKLESVGYGVENGATLPQLQTLNVRACIHGHDHLNDYSVHKQGMELIYGRATGYNGYGHEHVPKGGKLYVLNCETGKYAWSSVLADGSHWTPRGRVESWTPELWS